ncbi:MAG: hypothetical protein MH204_12475, partial [Fimbriimonadaceae bacterium]|nr:hypothetical protein [Fimbriimonadaceae bacterium]
LFRSVSVPVLGDRALPPVEILPPQEGYTFANKYTPGATAEPCPPTGIPEERWRACMELALQVHQVLGCEGLTRTDMIVTPDRIVVLEINTVPGMTPTSLVPIAARAVGMSFSDLVEWIVADGLKRGGRS